eukprot:Pgem_evm1s998
MMKVIAISLASLMLGLEVTAYADCRRLKNNEIFASQHGAICTITAAYDASQLCSGYKTMSVCSTDDMDKTYSCVTRFDGIMPRTIALGNDSGDICEMKSSKLVARCSSKFKYINACDIEKHELSPDKSKCKEVGRLRGKCRSSRFEDVKLLNVDNNGAVHELSPDKSKCEEVGRLRGKCRSRRYEDVKLLNVDNNGAVHEFTVKQEMNYGYMKVSDTAHIKYKCADSVETAEGSNSGFGGAGYLLVKPYRKGFNSDLTQNLCGTGGAEYLLVKPYWKGFNPSSVVFAIKIL